MSGWAARGSGSVTAGVGVVAIGTGPGIRTTIATTAIADTADRQAMIKVLSD